jgi:hypothetical protein
VAPSAGLIAGTTGGLVLLTATTAAFAGVIADPVQRAFGLHQRRRGQLAARTTPPCPRRGCCYHVSPTKPPKGHDRK